MSAKLDRMLGRRPMRTLVAAVYDMEEKLLFERLFESRWLDGDKDTALVYTKEALAPAHHAKAIGDEFECKVDIFEASPDDIARLTGPWGPRQTVTHLKAA